MKDALQGDCTRYAPGIEIISVRITKPTIPESIRQNFEQMEEERTKVHSLPNEKFYWRFVWFQQSENSDFEETSESLHSLIDKWAKSEFPFIS